MTTRHWIVLATVLGGLFAGYFLAVPHILAHVESDLNRTASPGPVEVSDEARSVHDGAVVVDLHADSLLWGRDLLERSPVGHVDVPRLREGGVAVQVFGLVTQAPEGQNYARNSADTDRITKLAMASLWPPATWRSYRQRALYQLGRLERTAKRSDGALRRVLTHEDLDAVLAARAAGEPVIGALAGLEGAHGIRSVKDLEELHAAGLRMVGLAHFIDNAAAGSAHGLEQHGLTPLGRDLLAAAERLGLAVDLAHASPAAVDDALALATRPVVVSHGGVAGTCPGPRTLTDAHLRGIAATGGVVGIGFFAGAVCEADVDAIAEAIVYALRVAGPDHVALGSDFDGTVTTPFDASGLPRLTEALLDRGLDRATVEKVLGGNAVRVLRETLPAL